MNILPATRRLFFLLAFLFCIPFLQGEEPSAASYSFFIPPQDWLMADPNVLPPRVKISFLSKVNSGYCPSINLATEKVQGSLREYLRAVKKIYEANPESRWREIGSIRSKAGVAILTEYDTKSEWGPVRLIQMILVRDKTAYILTASALKEEFSKFYSQFEKSFRSFTITDDLISIVQDVSLKKSLEEKRKKVQEAFIQEGLKDGEDPFARESFQKEHWLPFQNFVIAEFSALGAPWQVEFLQSVRQSFCLDGISTNDYKSGQQK